MKRLIIKLVLLSIIMASCESKEERIKRQTDEIWASVDVNAELKAQDFDKDVKKVRDSYDTEAAASDFNRKYEQYLGMKIYGFEFDNDGLLDAAREKYKAVISKELSQEAYEKVQQLIE